MRVTSARLIFAAILGTAGALGGPVRGEEELLEELEHFKPNSRLSCQIEFGPELDGLKVTIAPEE